MATFNLAIEPLLDIEKGFNDIPNDRGGPTNFGISLKWCRQAINPSATTDDIRNLTRARAIEMYRERFWKFDAINSQEVANKIFEMAVHASGATPFIVQKSLNYVSKAGLLVDGIFGPKTVMAINNCASEALLKELRARAAFRYAEIVFHDPTQMSFMLGWCRRAVS